MRVMFQKFCSFVTMMSLLRAMVSAVIATISVAIVARYLEPKSITDFSILTVAEPVVMP